MCVESILRSRIYQEAYTIYQLEVFKPTTSQEIFDTNYKIK